MAGKCKNGKNCGIEKVGAGHWDCLDYYRTIQNYPEPYEDMNKREYHGMLWNIIESYGKLWKAMESYGTFWNMVLLI